MQYTLTRVLILTISLAIGLSSCKKDDPTDGLNSLVRTYEEPVGSNCASGGIRIETGVDMNSNGELEASEVDEIKYVCNGNTNQPLTYAAILSQQGSSAPSGTIVNNELGVTITWTRAEQGKYTGTISSPLDLQRTLVLNNSNMVSCQLTSATEIKLENSCGVNAWCDGFQNLMVEIRVYP